MDPLLCNWVSHTSQFADQTVDLTDDGRESITGRANDECDSSSSSSSTFFNSSTRSIESATNCAALDDFYRDNDLHDNPVASYVQLSIAELENFRTMIKTLEHNRIKNLKSISRNRQKNASASSSTATGTASATSATTNNSSNIKSASNDNSSKSTRIMGHFNENENENETEEEKEEAELQSLPNCFSDRIDGM